MRWLGGACAVLVGLALVAGLGARPAFASTNASSAAGFIESAQNRDGGFSASYGGVTRSGGPSNPAASLWATVALLAAGKNPVDEALNGGQSAQAYLSAHLGSLTSLSDLGLLAVIQHGSGLSAATFGDPAAALQRRLTPAAVAADPEGGALGAIGLVAVGDRAAARRTVTDLLADQARDGGWAEAGTDPSAATALVLLALADTGLASTRGADAVPRALGYLRGAQINDGSIAQSTQSATAGSGDVAATAFTIEALAALHRAPLRTSTGVTVTQGLANYQQQSGNGRGGLSPYGAYDTGVAPSVLQTAQAYPAFDGVTLPLPSVAPTPAAAVTPRSAPAPRHGASRTVDRASAGTATSGISAAGRGPIHAAGAYQGASAAGRTGARPKPHHGTVATQSGAPEVTGAVVDATPPPKLTSIAGRPPGRNHDALYLAVALGLVAVLGAIVDVRTPRRRDRSPVAVGVARADRFARWFVTRGSVGPALAATVGLALVASSIVDGLWSRTPRAAHLLRAFAPYMTPTHLARLNGEVSLLQTAVRETGRLPAVRSFATGQWPATNAHFAHTLATVTAQRAHYATLRGLPSFTLLPWCLLLGGGLLLALAAVALRWPQRWGRLRWGVAVTGLVLVLAPLTLGFFSGTRQGASLVRAFSTVETRANVTAMQTGFSDLVIGESEIAAAASDRAGARRYPAAARLGGDWTRILEDITPLLGVMSDNVANYRAVVALGNLQILPWLFAGPGLLAVALALLAAPPGRRPRPGRLRRAAAVSLSPSTPRSS